MYNIKKYSIGYGIELGGDHTFIKDDFVIFGFSFGNDITFLSMSCNCMFIYHLE